MLSVVPLDGDVVLEARPSPALAPATLKIIRGIWDREQGKRARPLYDGKLFSLEQREGRRLQGCLVDYSWFIAQRAEPALYAELRLRPVAVSGLLISPDGIVFGKRARDTTQDPGRWEAVPSGGIDGGTLDPYAKLLEELEEETGCPGSSVARRRTLGVIEDGDRHSVEIGIALETALGATELRRLHDRSDHREYEALEIVPAPELRGFIAERQPIEVSQALLKLRGLM